MQPQIKRVTDCTLILPHFDDEYCGCRSIVGSFEWNITAAIVITDSTTQFHPIWPPDEYYRKRRQETYDYLHGSGHNCKLICLDFPEQLWTNSIVYMNVLNNLNN